jgi:thiosulfate/3-mercaptopyruvate sulfurtransferase
MKAVFAEAGIDPDKPVVTMCGSGITAATLSFALHLIGAEKTALYDGSWAEWGSLDDTTKVTGAA